MTHDRRPRVLIADDDPSIRRVLAASLEKEGYQTLDACDGGEALTAMRTGQPDLVLLDLMMPKVTGWQVLTECAADPELRKIPVIVITAEPPEGVAKIARDATCALLHKPFDLRNTSGVGEGLPRSRVVVGCCRRSPIGRNVAPLGTAA